MDAEAVSAFCGDMLYVRSAVDRNAVDVLIIDWFMVVSCLGNDVEIANDREALPKLLMPVDLTAETVLRIVVIADVADLQHTPTSS